MVTVVTDHPVYVPGVYRCAKCETAEQSFEHDDLACECPHCQESVSWLYIRPLQPFAW
jgi:Zn finger protein HypA/HybF involved in hydrogenase expression